MKEMKFLLKYETEKEDITDEEIQMIMKKVGHTSVTVIPNLETYERIIILSLKEVQIVKE
jgi:hypothetical protein